MTCAKDTRPASAWAAWALSSTSRWCSADPPFTSLCTSCSRLPVPNSARGRSLTRTPQLARASCIFCMGAERPDGSAGSTHSLAPAWMSTASKPPICSSSANWHARMRRDTVSRKAMPTEVRPSTCAGKAASTAGASGMPLSLNSSSSNSPRRPGLARRATRHCAPEPSQSSTACCPPSTSSSLSTLSNSARFMVTEGRPSPAPIRFTTAVVR
mmetsp:Transcript_2470/g.6906  ORF Transcript_2470/g.6906 Transcript_2470/m.6906 type:complete len:213 (-) Transcript_2470:162-800(-)